MADETTLNSQTNDPGTNGTPAADGGGTIGADGTTGTTGGTGGSGLGATPPADDKGAVKGPANFPDNWRELMAPKGADGKPDAKALALLQRYADPTMAGKGLADLNAKIASGEFSKKLDKDATPEQVKEFRDANGIPEKIEDYSKMVVPQGVVVGEADKPLVESFMKNMLDNNVPPAMAAVAMKSYYDNVDKMMAQTQEADAQYVSTQEDQLRQEWGADFRPNMNAISSLLATFPESVANSLIHARGPDGRLLGDNKEFRMALAQLAIERNPASTVIPATSGDPAKGLDDKIKEYETLMKTDIKAWHKNDTAQKEYSNLLTIKQKMNPGDGSPRG